MEKFETIINSNIPVLVDFFATWCGPCKMVSPILQQVKSELGEQIRIIKIDVDKNQQLAQRFQIRSVPTLMIFQHGKQQWSGAGVMQADQIIAIIRSTTN